MNFLRFREISPSSKLMFLSLNVLMEEFWNVLPAPGTRIQLLKYDTRLPIKSKRTLFVSWTQTSLSVSEFLNNFEYSILFALFVFE